MPRLGYFPLSFIFLLFFLGFVSLLLQKYLVFCIVNLWLKIRKIISYLLKLLGFPIVFVFFLLSNVILFRILIFLFIISS